MAAGTLNDYERRRLENIRRNDEMLAALNLRAAAAAAALKRPAPHTPNKIPKKPRPHSPNAPVVLRRSLRTRGLPPTPSNHDFAAASSPKSPPSSPLASPRRRGPLKTQEAFVDVSGSSDRGLMDTILSGARIPRRGCSEDKMSDPRRSLVLRPEKVVKVVPERILAVRFFPLQDRTVVVVGDKAGHVGFWDLGFEENAAGVYLYAPHSAPVSGILVHPFSAMKMFTSSYDGFIRLMDAEKEIFDMIYSTDYSIYSSGQNPDDNNSLYFGEGSGDLKVWDERAGKVSNSWDLHEHRINTIDFNPENTNMMATSSTDGEVCLWDLRSIKKDRPESMKSLKHDRAVHSAYFSPSGSCLATTSIDDRVRILRGVNFDDQFMVRHNNQTGRWLSTFRAIWGWDDSYLYLGNMGRAVDIISTAEKTTTPLESEHMTSIPCRFAAHPYIQGSLACATAGGKVFLWTKA